MNVSYWISRRLQLRGGPGSGSSAGAVIAVAGIALALVVMELTIAVVIGFKEEIRHKLMGFDAQVTVYPAYDPTTGSSAHSIDNYDNLRSIISESTGSSDIRAVIRQPGILKTDNDFQGVIFIGQSCDAPFEFELGNITEGCWPDYCSVGSDADLVISQTLARSLGLSVGDKLFSTFIIDGEVKLRRNRVAALYSSSFGEYDRNVVYASLRMLRRVSGLDSLSCTSIDVRGIADSDIAATASVLQSDLLEASARPDGPGLHPVSSVMECGALYFNWLALLDTNVVVIFVLMLCVAAFTLISSLFILILERVRTIGVLRAIGADRRTVERVFMFMAMRLVAMGMLLGNLAGIALILIQHYTNAVPLDPEMYYLRSVPAALECGWFLLLNVGVALAAWLVLVLPERLTASVDPARVMHYE